MTVPAYSATLRLQDLSPRLPNRAGVNGSNPLTTEQLGEWVETYLTLLKCARIAITKAGHLDSIMMYISIDHLWDRPVQKEGSTLHVGTKPFLDELWKQMENQTLVFATAVHPYDDGNPADDLMRLPHRVYTFRTLSTVVEYTRKKLSIHKVDPDSPEGKPFTLLYPDGTWHLWACC